MDIHIISTLAVVAAVLVAAIIDFRTGRIPDVLTATLAGICLAVALYRHSIIAALLGALVTAGPLLLVYLVTRGRGIGLGDVKLAAGIGLGLGIVAGFTSIDIAVMLGGIFGILGLLMKTMHRKTRIPFGPFIALGTLIEVFTSAHEVIFR